MSDLFTQGNMTPQRCEFLCCHGYASIVTCYPRDLTESSGRNRLKAWFMAAAYVLEGGGKPKRRVFIESFARNSQMARSNTTLSAIFGNVTRISRVITC